jgi:hypothetical protein
MKQLTILSFLVLTTTMLAACGADSGSPTATGTDKQALASAAQPDTTGGCPMAGTGDCSTCPHNQDGQCNCPNRAADGSATPGTCLHRQGGQGMSREAGNCPGMGGQGAGGQGMGGSGMVGQGTGCQGMNGEGNCAHMKAGQGPGSCPHHQAGMNGQP